MKKFLSLLTVLALIMSLMPAAMAADDVIDTAEELQSAIDNAVAGDTITLGGDITLTLTAGQNYCLLINKGITLDGNGHKLTFSGAYNSRVINVETTGTVEIKDLVVETTGERVFNVINQPATLKLNGVTATAGNYAVMVATSADGVILDVDACDLTGLSVINVAGPNAQVTVDNTKLTCNDQSEAEGYAALYLHNTATDSTITAANVTFDIKGDSLKAATSAEGGSITIGGSTNDVEMQCVYISYGDYAYSFATLQDAIDYVKDNECVVLAADNSETVTVSRSVTFTLDENGTNFTGEIKAGDNTTMTVSEDNVYTFVYTEPSNPPAPPTPSNPPAPPAPPADPSDPPAEGDDSEEGEEGGRIFDDIGEDHTFVNEIEWAYEEGYVKGVEEDTYDASASISRQQLWMVLSRHAEKDAGSMAEAKAWAMELGLSDGTNPGAAISRQQMVTILYRYAQLMGYDTSAKADLSAYPDAANVADYAADAMAWAVANGIINGTTAGTLNPAGNTTRGAFAAILYRFSNLPA